MQGKKKMNILLAVFGFYLIFDGAYSIVRYWNAPVTDHFIDLLYKLFHLPAERTQGWPDHAIRLFRAFVGLYCIYAGWL
jgi:hypothetical protein